MNPLNPRIQLIMVEDVIFGDVVYRDARISMGVQRDVAVLFRNGFVTRLVVAGHRHPYVVVAFFQRAAGHRHVIAQVAVRILNHPAFKVMALYMHHHFVARLRILTADIAADNGVVL